MSIGLNLVTVLVTLICGLGNAVELRQSPKYPVGPLCQQQIDEYLINVNSNLFGTEWALKSKFTKLNCEHVRACTYSV